MTIVKLGERLWLLFRQGLRAAQLPDTPIRFAAAPEWSERIPSQNLSQTIMARQENHQAEPQRET